MSIIFSFLLFLFILYVFSRDDFTFLRKNVTGEKLFDMVFLATTVGLIFSRSAYVMLHPSAAYFNPLVFLLVWYFPGLSFSGFLLGGVVTVYIVAMRAKFPIGRLFDIVAVSCLFAFAFYEILQSGLYVVHKQSLLSLTSVGIGIFAFVWYAIARKIFLTTSWKDGLLATVTVSVISVLALFFQEVVMSFKAFPSELFVFLLLLLLFWAGYSVQFVRRAKRS